MEEDNAITLSLLIFVHPHAPRPVMYQVPFSPNDQYMSSIRMSSGCKHTRPVARVCRAASAGTGEATVAERTVHTAKSTAARRIITKDRKTGRKEEGEERRKRWKEGVGLKGRCSTSKTRECHGSIRGPFIQNAGKLWHVAEIFEALLLLTSKLQLLYARDMALARAWHN